MLRHQKVERGQKTKAILGMVGFIPSHNKGWSSLYRVSGAFYGLLSNKWPEMDEWTTWTVSLAVTLSSVDIGAPLLLNIRDRYNDVWINDKTFDSAKVLFKKCLKLLIKKRRLVSQNSLELWKTDVRHFWLLSNFFKLFLETFVMFYEPFCSL